MAHPSSESSGVFTCRCAVPHWRRSGSFTFQAGWNVFLWALIVFNDPAMSTVQMGLQSFSFNKQTDYGPLMAASVVVSLPVLIVFIFAQRYFTQSISFTGVKG
jgi:multiple sugar transport system permease protein